MSDCGVQSDQAISNYYSELNHLTQELQGSNTELDVAVDRIGLNENNNVPRDSTKTFYATDEHRTEPDGDDDVSSPLYHRQTNENVNHIAQYVSDVHKETVLLAHNGQHSDASADETDGDRLNVGDFSGLGMLQSVNLQSEQHNMRLRFGQQSKRNNFLLLILQAYHKVTHRHRQRCHKTYGMAALKPVPIL